MKLETGDLIFFGRERCGCGPHCCKRQLCHCFISCGTCSKYTHVGIIKVEGGEIFVYESAIHHHNKVHKEDVQKVELNYYQNRDCNKVNKEGVQKVPLNYYKDRDWYVRKRIGIWNVQLNKSKYSKGYNWCMWDWCRARIRGRSCCRYSKKTFCSEYVALQLGLDDADLMTPKDLAKGKLENYGEIVEPISKEIVPVYNPMNEKFKFNF